MVKRPTRLQFTEDDLSSDAVKKAAGKADKAATKAEKAVDRLTPKKHRKLRQESDISADRTKKLRFDKAKSEEIPPKPSGIKRVAARAPADTLSAAAHKSISKYEDNNVGVQAAHQTELGAETAYHATSHAAYSHKLKAYDKAEKLVEKSDKANVNALFERFKKENPDASSNPVSRWRQKHNIKKEYAAARAGKGGKATAKGVEKTAKGTKTVTQKIADFCVSHKTVLLWVLALALLFMVVSGMFSACSTMFQGGTQVVLSTSFTAEDEDILEAGIKIISQPPGKKLQNMMQLSGGEKALTAIALLFAIQNLKPSPFCLLDEIEAALDDSNVGRFAGYLQKLTKNTQFIIITHRRGTMNAADRLYGITMQEKGVSTLVSVDLVENQLTR